MRVLFPGIDDHPVLRELEVSDIWCKNALLTSTCNYFPESLTLRLLCTPNKMDFGSSASAVKLLWNEKVQENVKCSAVLWFICVLFFPIWLKKVFCPLSEAFHHDLIKIFFNPYYLESYVWCDAEGPAYTSSSFVGDVLDFFWVYLYSSQSQEYLFNFLRPGPMLLFCFQRLWWWSNPFLISTMISLTFCFSEIKLSS